VKRAIVALTASAAVLVVAGCGSPAPSAATACKDFATWQDAQGENNYAALDMSELQAARSAAPAGTLHNDISGLVDIVRYAHDHPKARAMAGVGIDVVMQDCHISD
jgi:hypothetical protein